MAAERPPARPADRAAEPSARLARRTRIALFTSIALSVAIVLIPHGGIIGYPLLLLSTVAHELGHATTAILLGGDLVRLEVHSDAGGVAVYRAAFGPFAQALTAAGGLVGPALVAAVCFACGHGARLSRCLWIALAIGLGLLLLRVPTQPLFGTIFLGLVLLCALSLAAFAPPWTIQFATLFLGVQLALSVFTRADYLFSETAGAPGTRSDVAQISAALGLPYWFWGLVCGGISVWILVLGARPHLRRREGVGGLGSHRDEERDGKP